MNESMIEGDREQYKSQIKILKENNLELENKLTLVITENDRLCNKLQAKEEQLNALRYESIEKTDRLE